MAICQTNNMTAIESGERLNSAWQYAPTPGLHDEMLVGPGAPRTHWRSLAGALNSLGPEGLEKRWTEGRRLLHDHGVTYNVYGEEATAGRAGPAGPGLWIRCRSCWILRNGQRLKLPLCRERRFSTGFWQISTARRRCCGHASCLPNWCWNTRAFCARFGVHNLRAGDGCTATRLTLHGLRMGAGEF